MNFPFRFSFFAVKCGREEVAPLIMASERFQSRLQNIFQLQFVLVENKKTKPSFQLFSFPINDARPRRLLGEASKLFLCVLIANFFGFLCKVHSIRKFNFLSLWMPTWRINYSSSSQLILPQSPWRNGCFANVFVRR